MATTAATPKTVTLTIDGATVQAAEDATIWEAARDAGIEIPVLCHDERYDPVGVCRVCAVDIGQRVLAAACVRTVEEGMEVRTSGDQVEAQRRMLVRLLMADQPAPEDDPKETTTADNELLALARRYDAVEHGLPDGEPRPTDASNPVIETHHGACILCDRCVRACDDVQGNDVIGRSGKGYETRIAFDLDAPMGESSCVSCGGVRCRVPDRRRSSTSRSRCRSARARSSRKSTPCAPTAVWAARSPTTSTRTPTRSCSPRGASSPAHSAACASRAATAGTTR